MTCRLNFTLFVVLFFAISGCLGPRRDTTTQFPFQQESAEYVLLVAIDMSGSFSDFMSKDGRAYDFLLQAIDQYHRDGIGSDFQIIITQLSANNNPLLWQGTAQQLRREFADAESFRDYLASHADADSSRINDGIAESIDYVLHTHSVANGNAKAVALILSDMEDSYGGADGSEERLINALTSFAHRGGIGFYFCDQQRLAYVRDKMSRAGIEMYNLECDIHGRPPIPSFDW